VDAVWPAQRHCRCPAHRTRRSDGPRAGAVPRHDRIRAWTAQIDPELAEWDYGCYDGMRTPEIHEHNPTWNVFHDGCPGGESLGQVECRADRLLNRLKALDGPVALFTHGQFGCLLAARWLGLAGSQGEHFVMEPASVSVLGGKPGHPGIPAIIRWNMEPALGTMTSQPLAPA